MEINTVTIIDLNEGTPNASIATLCLLVKKAGGTPVVIDGRTFFTLPDSRAVIFSGGPADPTDNRDWVRRLVVRLTHWRNGPPTFGICLGFQLMARAWGANLHRLSEKRIGIYPVSVLPEGQRDELFSRLNPKATCFEARQWGVRLLPSATALAGTEKDVTAARFTPTMAGVAFHCEADPDAALRFSKDRHATIPQINMSRCATTSVHEIVLPTFLATTLDKLSSKNDLTG